MFRPKLKPFTNPDETNQASRKGCSNSSGRHGQKWCPRTFGDAAARVGEEPAPGSLATVGLRQGGEQSWLGSFLLRLFGALGVLEFPES